MVKGMVMDRAKKCVAFPEIGSGLGLVRVRVGLFNKCVRYEHLVG